jgi:predicted dehydrogenase
MEQKRKLRVGVIGTGAFVQACHVPGLQSHPQAEVVALCGSEYHRARSLAETDDIAATWFRYENGIRGQWFVSRATPPFTENGYLEVIGPEGGLKAALSRGTVDVLQVSSPSRPGWEELSLPREARDGEPHCLGIMMRSFVDACLRGQLDERVDASFVDGVAAQRAIAAVLEANNHFIWIPLNRT